MCWGTQLCPYLSRVWVSQTPGFFVCVSILGYVGVHSCASIHHVCVSWVPGLYAFVSMLRWGGVHSYCPICHTFVYVGLTWMPGFFVCWKTV